MNPLYALIEFEGRRRLCASQIRRAEKEKSGSEELRRCKDILTWTESSQKALYTSLSRQFVHPASEYPPTSELVESVNAFTDILRGVIGGTLPLLFQQASEIPETLTDKAMRSKTLPSSGRPHLSECNAALRGGFSWAGLVGLQTRLKHNSVTNESHREGTPTPCFEQWEADLQAVLRETGDVVNCAQVEMLTALNSLGDGRFPYLAEGNHSTGSSSSLWVDLICMFEDAFEAVLRGVVQIILWWVSQQMRGCEGLAVRPLFTVKAIWSYSQGGVVLSPSPLEVHERILLRLRKELIFSIVPEFNLGKMTKRPVPPAVCVRRGMPREFFMNLPDLKRLWEAIHYSTSQRCDELAEAARTLTSTYAFYFTSDEQYGNLNLQRLRGMRCDAQHQFSESIHYVCACAMSIQLDALQQGALSRLEPFLDRARLSAQPQPIPRGPTSVTRIEPAAWAALLSYTVDPMGGALGLRSRLDGFRAGRKVPSKYDRGLDPTAHITRMLDGQRAQAKPSRIARREPNQRSGQQSKGLASPRDGGKKANQTPIVPINRQVARDVPLESSPSSLSPSPSSSSALLAREDHKTPHTPPQPNAAAVCRNGRILRQQQQQQQQQQGGSTRVAKTSPVNVTVRGAMKTPPVESTNGRALHEQKYPHPTSSSSSFPSPSPSALPPPPSSSSLDPPLSAVVETPTECESNAAPVPKTAAALDAEALLQTCPFLPEFPRPGIFLEDIDLHEPRLHAALNRLRVVRCNAAMTRNYREVAVVEDAAAALLEALAEEVCVATWQEMYRYPFLTARVSGVLLANLPDLETDAEFQSLLAIRETAWQQRKPLADVERCLTARAEAIAKGHPREVAPHTRWATNPFPSPPLLDDRECMKDGKQREEHRSHSPLPQRMSPDMPSARIATATPISSVRPARFTPSEQQQQQKKQPQQQQQSTHAVKESSDALAKAAKNHAAQTANTNVNSCASAVASAVGREPTRMVSCGAETVIHQTPTPTKTETKATEDTTPVQSKRTAIQSTEAARSKVEVLPSKSKAVVEKKSPSSYVEKDSRELRTNVKPKESVEEPSRSNTLSTEEPPQHSPPVAENIITYVRISDPVSTIISSTFTQHSCTAEKKVDVNDDSGLPVTTLPSTNSPTPRNRPAATPTRAVSEEIVQQRRSSQSAVPKKPVPESAVPKSSVPERAVPESAVPKSVVPQNSVPQRAVPERAVPERAVPERAVPKKSVPESAVPKSSVPERAVPQNSVPQRVVPQNSVPQRAVPERAVPERAVPERAVPERAVPESAGPQSPVAERAGPQNSAPQRAVPERAVPERTVPQSAVPKKPVPESAGPQRAVPERAVPERAVPKKSVPESAGPQSPVAERAGPQNSAPQRAVPERAVPERTVPQSAVPKSSVPERAGPQNSVPQRVVPKKPVPERTVPQSPVAERATCQSLPVTRAETAVAHMGSAAVSAPSSALGSVYNATVEALEEERRSLEAICLILEEVHRGDAKRLPGKASERVPEIVSERVPDIVSEGVPERVPEKASREISEGVYESESRPSVALGAAGGPYLFTNAQVFARTMPVSIASSTSRARPPLFASPADGASRTEAAELMRRVQNECRRMRQSRGLYDIPPSLLSTTTTAAAAGGGGGRRAQRAIARSYGRSTAPEQSIADTVVRSSWGTAKEPQALLPSLRGMSHGPSSSTTTTTAIASTTTAATTHDVGGVNNRPTAAATMTASQLAVRAARTSLPTPQQQQPQRMPWGRYTLLRRKDQICEGQSLEYVHPDGLSSVHAHGAWSASAALPAVSTGAFADSATASQTTAAHMPWEGAADGMSQQYVAFCKQAGVKPNSILLRALPERGGETVSRIDTSVNYIGPKGLQPLLQVMRHNVGLEYLNLSHNNLENEEIVDLVNVLVTKSGSALQHLDLSNNPIALSGGAALMRLVQSCPDLISVRLKGTLIPQQVMSSIQELCEKNRNPGDS